jgi:glycosyltransferase involved in cell wall biosynthesis
MCKKADMVLAVSDSMREYMISEEGIPPENVFVFPLGFDSFTVPSDVEISSLREHYGLENKKVVIYFGTMAKIRKLDLLAPIMVNVKKIFPDVILLLVGEGEKGEDTENLKSLFSRNDLDNNVLFVGKVKRQDVPLFIRLASVSISIIPPIFEYVVSSPMKAVESIGLGVPVVCNKGIPDQDYVVGESHGGIITEYDVEGLSNSIIKLLGDEKMCLSMGSAGKEWAQRNRSYLVLSDYVATLYSNLLEKRTTV